MEEQKHAGESGQLKGETPLLSSPPFSFKKTVFPNLLQVQHEGFRHRADEGQALPWKKKRDEGELFDCSAEPKKQTANAMATTTSIFRPLPLCIQSGDEGGEEYFVRKMIFRINIKSAPNISKCSFTCNFAGKCIIAGSHLW